MENGGKSADRDRRPKTLKTQPSYGVDGKGNAVIPDKVSSLAPVLTAFPFPYLSL